MSDPEYEALRAAVDADPGDADLVEQLHARYLELLPRGGVTPVQQLPYPSPTDQLSEGADAIRALAEAVEAMIAAGFPASAIVAGVLNEARLPFISSLADPPTLYLSTAATGPASGGAYAALRATGSLLFWLVPAGAGSAVFAVDENGQVTQGTVPAARITGELALARIPELPASKTTSGTFLAARIPKVMNLNGVSYGTGNPSGGADGDIYFRLV